MLNEDVPQKSLSLAEKVHQRLQDKVFKYCNGEINTK